MATNVTEKDKTLNEIIEWLRSDFILPLQAPTPKRGCRNK